MTAEALYVSQLSQRKTVELFFLLAHLLRHSAALFSALLQNYFNFAVSKTAMAGRVQEVYNASGQQRTHTGTHAVVRFTDLICRMCFALCVSVNSTIWLVAWRSATHDCISAETSMCWT